MPSKILAVVKNGKIEPLEPINFPEGTQLIVTLNLSAEAVGKASRYENQEIEEVKKNPWLAIEEVKKNPWLATAGNLANDPFFEEYIAEIDRYRQEIDREASELESDINRSLVV